MQHTRTTQESKLERRKASAKQARKWGRVCVMCLFALCMSAIYQERALSPDLHDQMHLAAEATVDFINNSEGSAGVLSAIGTFGGGAGDGQYDPITTALLKLRQ